MPFKAFVMVCHTHQTQKVFKISSKKVSLGIDSIFKVFEFMAFRMTLKDIVNYWIDKQPFEAYG